MRLEMRNLLGKYESQKVFFGIMMIVLLSSLTWSQTTIYSQDFTGEDGKGQVGSSLELDGVDWTIDVNAGGFTSGDYFAVQNGIFESKDVDGPVIWQSKTIDITGFSSLEFSFYAKADGDFEANKDIFDVVIIINETEISLYNGTVKEDEAGDPMYFGSIKLNESLQLFTKEINATGTDASIKITTDNNAGTEIYGWDNLILTGISSTSAPEPSNHVSGFKATVSDHDQIELSWNDNDGAQPAHGFLILGKTGSGTFATPSDYTDTFKDTDWNDEDYEVKVGHGIESHTVTNLNPGTGYDFRIYPYTNSGNDIDYKLDGTIPQTTATTDTEPNIPQIIITEIMQNPAAVNDNNGEWFELYNASGTMIDVNGWIIKDVDSDLFTIKNGGSLVIPANGFLVLGKNANTSENGDVEIDYEYSSFSLSNGADEVIVSMSDGTVVDRVEYDGGPDWPDPIGASMVFNGHYADDNNDYNNWSTSTTKWDINSDKGSPGYNGIDQSLPVELASFSANYENGIVTLTWETSSEVNNAGFYIYKSVNNRKGFKKLNSELIPGAGNTSTKQSYSYQDNQVIEGVKYFYKLQDISYSDEKEFSRTISINPNSAREVRKTKSFGITKCYPNPFNPSVNICFHSANTNIIDVIIYNLNGKIVKSMKNLSINSGYNKIVWHGIDKSNDPVSSGIYFIKINTNEKYDIKKVVLVR